MKIHVYSDLYLRYFAFADPVDEQVPDCDLVVVAGSISDNAKRSLLFQETISVVSGKPVIVNYSLTEFAKGDFYHDVVEATAVRYQMKTDVNCHYHFNKDIKLEDPKLNVLAVTGWPYITAGEPVLIKHPVRVKFGKIYNEQNELIAQVEHTPPTREEINELHQIERSRIEAWLTQPADNPRLLVIGSNAEQLLKDLDLTGVVVITTGSEFKDHAYQGGRLYANPGSGVEARSNILTI